MKIRQMLSNIQQVFSGAVHSLFTQEVASDDPFKKEIRSHMIQLNDLAYREHFPIKVEFNPKSSPQSQNSVGVLVCVQQEPPAYPAERKIALKISTTSEETVAKGIAAMKGVFYAECGKIDHEFVPTLTQELK